MFQVGDKVRVIDPTFRCCGEVGVITGIYTGIASFPYDYAVSIGGLPMAMRRSELVAVTNEDLWR